LQWQQAVVPILDHNPSNIRHLKIVPKKLVMLSILSRFVRRVSEGRNNRPGEFWNKFRKPQQTKGVKTMRVMVVIKATKDTEAGVLPDEKLLTDMGRFNEELVKAGVMLAGEGLQPSSKGARVKFSGEKRSVIDGPFTETKELIAGFWLWQVRSMEEAIEWVKRCPNPTGAEAEIEIRPLFEAVDFGAEFTPELREQEERLRKQIEKQTRL
jgi:hypothetical protein